MPRWEVKGGTDPVYVTGKARWAKLINPDPQYEKWAITVYPINEDMPKVHKLISDGIKNTLKKDDDGYYITFSRPIRIKLRTGMTKPMDAPVVIDADGSVFSSAIGDGSDVTVKLDTYGGPGPGGRGSYKAARLAAVRINNLVPYDRNSMNDNEQKLLGELDKQPKQEFPF